MPRGFQFLPYRRMPHARWSAVGQRRHYLIPPPPPGASNKLGFGTYAMWALCLVVVGVCYKLEQDDLAKRPAEPDVPDDVKKVLPSGMWLMSTPPTSRVQPALPLLRLSLLRVSWQGTARSRSPADQLRGGARADPCRMASMHVEEPRPLHLRLSMATPVHEQDPCWRRVPSAGAGWASPQDRGLSYGVRATNWCGGPEHKNELYVRPRGACVAWGRSSPILKSVSQFTKCNNT